MLLKGYFTTVISSKQIDKNAKARIMVSNNGIFVAFFTADIVIRVLCTFVRKHEVAIAYYANFLIES